MPAKRFDADEAPQQPVSRRQRKAQATRLALIDAALCAFERQPIGLVSVLDITEAADVAKGVFYLHFASKDEFLLAVWQRILDNLLDGASAEIPADATTAQRRAAVIGAYYDQAVPDARSARFCLRLASFLPDEIGPPGRMCDMLSQYLQRLDHLLNDAVQPEERIDAANVDAVCWALLWQPMRLNLAPTSRDAFIAAVNRAVAES